MLICVIVTIVMLFLYGRKDAEIEKNMLIFIAATTIALCITHIGFGTTVETTRYEAKVHGNDLTIKTDDGTEQTLILPSNPTVYGIAVYIDDTEEEYVICESEVLSTFGRANAWPISMLLETQKEQALSVKDISELHINKAGNHTMF